MNQTHDVTEKRGLRADDLGSSNEVAKIRQAAGPHPLSADKSLQNNRRVQREVRDCALDLHELTGTSLSGIGEVRAQTGIALAESKSALANSEAALATAREHARDADTVCRNDGGDFLYLLMNPQGSENIARIAGALLRTIAQPIDTGDHRDVPREKRCR